MQILFWHFMKNRSEKAVRALMNIVRHLFIMNLNTLLIGCFDFKSWMHLAYPIMIYSLTGFLFFLLREDFKKANIGSCNS